VSAKWETASADVLPRQQCIPESGPKAESVVLLLEQAACLQKRIPGHAQEPGAPHVMPRLATEPGTVSDKQRALPVALFPCTVGLVLTHRVALK